MVNNEVVIAMSNMTEQLESVKRNLQDISSMFKNLSDAIAPASKNLNDIKDTLESMNGIKLSDVLSIGSFVVDMGALGFAAIQMSTTVSDTVKEVLGTLKDESKDLKELSKQIGKYIVEGIIEGIKSVKPKLMLLVQELGEDNIIKTFVKEFEISSPSRVMKRLGQYISEGIGEGIKDGGKHIKSAMGNTTDTIENASKKMSKIKFGLGGLKKNLL